MRRIWTCREVVTTVTVKRPFSFAPSWSNAYESSSLELCCTNPAPCKTTLVSRRNGRIQTPSLQRQGDVGTGGSSPALFRPTRVTRIPPQLMRFVITVGAGLLQVFLVAYQREKQKMRQGESSHVADGTTQNFSSMSNPPAMSPVEAARVLGLDSSFPDLFTSLQQACTASTVTPPFLPLTPGEARITAQKNFERMFALAVKEGNMFLAGKLSAAYRICVDPEWDRQMPNEKEATTNTNK